jgi:copper chaperone CopZ
VIAVTGMTCEHCVAAVTDELSALSGVRSVDATLSNGAVTICSSRALTDAEISTAVAEAGYAIAD